MAFKVIYDNRLTVCAIVPERSEWDREARRWGGDGEAVQPEKGYGVENCLGCAHAALKGGSPQRQVHALLG